MTTQKELLVQPERREQTPNPVKLSQKLIDTIKVLQMDVTLPRDDMARALWCTKRAVDHRIQALYLLFGTPAKKGEGPFKHRERLLDSIENIGYVLNERPVLNQKQIEILRWAGFGKNNQEIVRHLRPTYRTITYNTVHNCLQRAYRSLGVNDRTQAVIKAINLGFFTLEEFTENDELGRINLLFPKEREILADITRLENTPGVKSVARRLIKSYRTANKQFGSILKKLQVHSRTQAALFYLAAKEKGLIPTAT